MPRKTLLSTLAFALAAPAVARADDEVHVRGNGVEAGAVAASSVPEARLRAPGQKTADVLRPLPGVAVTETGAFGAPASVSVRGATAAQTPVFLAGVRLNDDVAGTADLSLVPPWALDRIDVYRGHAPAWADPLGIGGAVDLVPRRPRRDEVRAGAMFGSFGARAVWAHGAVAREGASVVAGARLERADNDYAFGPGGARRANADAQAVDVAALARARTGRASHVQLVFHAVGREQGLPGLALLPTAEARGRLQRELAAVSATTACPGELACTLHAAFSVLLARAAYRDPRREAGIGATAAELVGSRLEQSAVATFGAGATRATIALRGSTEALRADARDEEPLRARRIAGRATALGEWDALAPLTLRALASVAAQGTSLGGGARGLRARKDDAAQPSGRAGAELRLGRVTLLANAGLYARTPTLAELYGLTGVVRGNPDLAAETGITGDVGGRARAPVFDGGEARVEIFAFARAVRDLVAYRRSSIGYALPYNVGEARLLGVEAVAAVDPARFLGLEVSATALDARDVTADRTLVNDVLPYRARLTVAPRVEVRAGEIAALAVRRASLSLAYLWFSSRFVDPAGLVVLPAQGSLDLEAEVALVDHVAIRARAANLLDATRVDVLGLPLPGRAAYASMEVSGP